MDLPLSRLAAVSLLLLAGAVRAQETPARDGGAPFEFAWPVPCSAVVTMDGEKKGRKVRMRFRLDVAAAENGELRARSGDFAFLELDGRDATTPEMRQMLAPTLALTQAVPDIVVDARGRYLRVDGIEAMLERVAKFLAEQHGESEADREAALRAVRSPAMLASLQEACSADWNTWAGGWVDFAVVPGAGETSTAEGNLLGVALPATATRHHHGAADGHPGHVRLSCRTVFEGEPAKAALAEAMARTAPSGAPPLPADRIEEARGETVLEVVTDPRSLLPLRASRTKTMRLVLTGEPPREEIERRDYTFEWAPVTEPR